MAYGNRRAKIDSQSYYIHKINPIVNPFQQTLSTVGANLEMLTKRHPTVHAVIFPITPCC